MMILSIVFLLVVVEGVFSLSPHIPIRFETDQLLVIEKPTGIAHHDKTNRSADDETDDTTITNGVLTLLRQQYPRLKGQLYGVHRLDQVTSGLLVVAKQPAMARCLTQAFTDRHVVKYYTGLSVRTPKKKKQGWVNGYMRRGRRKSWYLTKEKTIGEDGNDSDDGALWAKSYFWTAGLGQLAEAYRGPKGQEDPNMFTYPRTLILFRPYTGRTHQLRVASKSLGVPLLGDPLYATATTLEDNTISKSFPRTCLHATGLHIPVEYLREGGLTEDLTLWSPPPFLAWWGSDNRPDVVRLLQKDSSIPDCLLEKALNGSSMTM